MEFNTFADETWKPCPFCGGKAKIETQEFYKHVCSVSETGNALLSVECSECGAKLTNYADGESEKLDYFDRMGIMRQMWNRRCIA